MADELSAFLTSIKLEKYLSHFADKGYTSLAQCQASRAAPIALCQLKIKYKINLHWSYAPWRRRCRRRRSPTLACPPCTAASSWSRSRSSRSLNCDFANIISLFNRLRLRQQLSRTRARRTIRRPPRRLLMPALVPEMHVHPRRPCLTAVPIVIMRSDSMPKPRPRPHTMAFDAPEARRRKEVDATGLNISAHQPRRRCCQTWT